MKPKFDYRNYKYHTVMHCSSEEEALIFTNYMYNNGLYWCDGNSYINIMNYERYEERTCYNFITGAFGTVEFYRAEGFKILKFDDFDWGLDESEENSEELTTFLNSFS